MLGELDIFVKWLFDLYSLTETVLGDNMINVFSVACGFLSRLSRVLPHEHYALLEVRMLYSLGSKNIIIIIIIFIS